MKALLSTFQILLALSTGATSITPVINSSSVSIRGSGAYTGGATNYNASANASIMEPFAADLSGSAVFPISHGPFESTTFGESRAIQNSSVDGSRIAAQGSAHASAYFGGEAFLELLSSGTANAVSIFDLIFQLNEPQTYHLAGSLGANGSGLNTAGTAAIILSLLEGATVLDLGRLLNGDLSDGNPNWDRRFDLTGDLAPGTYRITAIAQTSIGSTRSSGPGGPDTEGFDFTMDFTGADVPDAGSTGALLMGVLVILLLWRGHANRRALLSRRHGTRQMPS